jgi:hypothetical protein
MKLKRRLSDHINPEDVGQSYAAHTRAIGQQGTNQQHQPAVVRVDSLPEQEHALLEPSPARQRTAELVTVDQHVEDRLWQSSKEDESDERAEDENLEKREEGDERGRRARRRVGCRLGGDGPGSTA